MSHQPSLWDLPNATSSPGSVSGPGLCGRPAGLTIDRSGPAAALASLSARQAIEQGLMMSGTCGPTGSSLSRSAALASSLESKLRRRTASGGSILYRTTWEQRITPAGRSISALRALAWDGGAAPMRHGWNGPYSIVPIPWLPGSFAILPIGLINLLASAGCTFGNGSTLSGWPTALANNGERGGSEVRAKNPAKSSDLHDFVLLSGWGTPEAEEARRGYQKRWSGKKGSQKSLTTEAVDYLDPVRGDPNLMGWPTPDAAAFNLMTDPDENEARRARAKEKHGNGNGAGQTIQQAAHLAGYPTPMAGTPAKGENSQAGNTDSQRITEAVLGREVTGAAVSLLPNWEPMRLTADGRLLTGCSAGMEAGGQLRPGHSRWLMRLPAAWASCAPSATASTLKRRRPFAKRSGS